MPASWIDGADAPQAEFPLQNLPYGVFRRAGQAPRCGVAIGDQVLDLSVLEAAGLLDAGGGRAVFGEAGLNAFMALGAAAWARVRERLTELLAEGGDPALSGTAELRGSALAPLAEVELLMPIRVAGYTDFNASRQHAVNAGSLLRGPQYALPPNWLHMPVGYNGRASTVVVSGTPIRRPLGQSKPAELDAPVFGPSRRLDFELEMGAIVGVPTEMGETLSVAEADARIFGYVLLNDWSARDIQGWESQPLGPFQGKAFGTSISPWVVTRAALEPFRVAAAERETPLLPYLAEPGPMLYDIALEAAILPAGSAVETVVTRSNARNLYFSAPQQLAHHAIGGCRMETGDLLGSGTISGVEPSAWASLLELTLAGREALALEGGGERRFLEDGDSVILRGYAERDGIRIGFGACTGTILPAHGTGG